MGYEIPLHPVPQGVLLRWYPRRRSHRPPLSLEPALGRCEQASLSGVGYRGRSWPQLQPDPGSVSELAEAQPVGSAGLHLGRLLPWAPAVAKTHFTSLASWKLPRRRWRLPLASAPLSCGGWGRTATVMPLPVVWASTSLQKLLSANK